MAQFWIWRGISVPNWCTIPVRPWNGFSVSSLTHLQYPLNTPHREPRVCIEGAVNGPFIMNTKVVSLKSYMKGVDYVCFPDQLVVCVESEPHLAIDWRH
jgi:hypothetical protein